MDIKVGGITMDIMRKALEQARTGRMFILQKMQDTLSVARENVSAHAPRIVTIRIPVDKIRDVIGPGGKMIRSIIERTGVKIDVEDDGRVNVASADEASAQKAIGIIQELTATPELNKTYLGKVQRITDFGAFVEIMPGLDGLLHVSEIAHYRVKDVRDELKEGEQVMVKVINIDPSGKIRLSRKALIDPPEGGVPPAGEGGPREGGERPRREGGRHEGGRHDGGRGGYRGDRDRDRGDRGHRSGHDRRSEGGHDRRPHADNTAVEATGVSGSAHTDEPSGNEKE
jgi:polyribonucleotide nucleotidyltransferase